MNEVNNISLEQAANNYMPLSEYDNKKDTNYIRLHQASFKAGAQWQKEQYEELINSLKEVTDDLFYQIEVKFGAEKAHNYPSIKKARELIKKYNN